MIPEFPNFKKIELSDREDVEKITQQFPPYSDFNFVSLHSWNIKGEMAISRLYDNLVVRFTDYLHGDYFYSFLGNNNVNETCRALIDLSKNQGLKPMLKLIPETVAQNIDRSLFVVQEDQDNFDYIYQNEHLAQFAGKRFQNKRNLFNRFKKSYADIDLTISSVLTEKTKRDILCLDKKWADDKKIKMENFDAVNEMQAVKNFINFFDTSRPSNFVFLCLYVKKELSGFSISSIINNDYAICHFSKGNTEYYGIYEYMLRCYAEHLHKNVKFVNYEQDLGLPNLRFSKTSFRPSALLKKYVIMES